MVPKTIHVNLSKKLRNKSEKNNQYRTPKYLPGTLEVGDRIGGSFLRWWTKDEADL